LQSVASEPEPSSENTPRALSDRADVLDSEHLTMDISDTMIHQLKSEGWAVQVGGTRMFGYSCKVLRNGRVSHHKAASKEKAVAAACCLGSPTQTERGEMKRREGSANAFGIWMWRP